MKLSNGDIIQALSMALAVRMKMVTANEQVLEKIVVESVSRAINASKSAVVESYLYGNSIIFVCLQLTTSSTVRSSALKTS